MSTTPSIPSDSPTPEGAHYYVPGYLPAKLAYLGIAIAVTLLGAAYLWEPFGRMIKGQVIEARIAEIRAVEPGKPDVVYKYRRDYPDERNLAIRFQHYVSIPVNGHSELFHLSADSRKAPISFYNINDRVRVAYYPGDSKRVAYAVEHARTWGAAGVIGSVGLVMLLTAIPLVLSARKPILIDPEAPSHS